MREEPQKFNGFFFFLSVKAELAGVKVKAEFNGKNRALRKPGKARLHILIQINYRVTICISIHYNTKFNHRCNFF